MTRSIRCGECATAFAPTQRKQVFCQHRCREAFHNRAAKRGKRLVPLFMAYREKRNSPTAKAALSEGWRLVAEFRAEDKAAGRMSAHLFMQGQYEMGLRG